MSASDAVKLFKLAITSEIPENGMAVFQVQGKNILVCHWQGQFYAIDNLCTHDNGPLGSGELLADGEVECPRHGARFDIKTGAALCLPAVGKVSTYPLEIRGEELYIGLHEKE